MGFGEWVVFLYSPCFLCVVNKVLTIGKQRHCQYREFAEYATGRGDKQFLFIWKLSYLH